MQRFRQLTVALARTGADAGLLEYAAAVARLGTAAAVRFVHVLPEAAAGHAERVREEMRAATAAALADMPPSVALHFDAVPGPLPDQLLTYTSTHHADLVLIGHRRDHPGRWMLARRLAMQAACSVWMVPEGSLPKFSRMLVPVDFSEPAADTMRVAASLARLAGGGEVLALHVYFNTAVATYDEYDEVLRGREQEAYDEFVSSLNLGEVPITPVFEEGVNAAHVINRVAIKQDCDLIVMATRGRSRSASVLLGSVTEETIQESRVPLLVVKHYGAQLGLVRALFETLRRPDDTRHF